MDRSNLTSIIKPFEVLCVIGSHNSKRLQSVQMKREVN